MFTFWHIEIASKVSKINLESHLIFSTPPAGMTKQKLRGWSQPQIKYETANQAKQGGLQAHYRNRKGVCVAKRGEVGGDRRLFAEITVVATQWPSRELLPRITRGRRGFMPIMIYKGRSWCSNCWLFCNYIMDSFWSYLGWISISIRKELDFFAVLCFFGRASQPFSCKLLNWNL